MMQKNPYAEAPIQKQPQQKPADPFQESNLEEFGDITFDSMVFPAYKDLTDSHLPEEEKLGGFGDIQRREEQLERDFNSYVNDQQIRDFYSSTSFNLHNYFETSKMAEIENLNRVIRRPKENPFNGTTAQIQEIISMFKGNLKNKSVAGLTKCLDLIDRQTEKLVAKQRELTAKLDLIVRNTSEDIKRIKLEEGRDEGFDLELTQSIFDEKNSCKQKFKTYLEKARVILGYKKEMKEISAHLLEELERIASQIRDYQVVVENIKVSLQTVVLPEVARRREFDALNKQYTAFYWTWITRETDAREKFVDTGDLQQLPMAFKKILVDLIFDENFELEARAQASESFRDLQALNAAMNSYFDRWTISPEASLKGKLEEYLRDNNDIRDQLAALSVHLEKTSKDRDRLLRLLDDRDKEVALLRSKATGDEGLKHKYDQRISELSLEVEAQRQDKQSLQDKCRSFSTEISSLANQLNSKTAELEACRKEQAFEVAELRQKLADCLAESESTAKVFKQQIAQLNQKLQSANSDLGNKSSELEAKVFDLSSQNSELMRYLQDSEKAICKMGAEFEKASNELILLKKRLEEQEDLNSALKEQIQTLKQELTVPAKAASKEDTVEANEKAEQLFIELSEAKYKLEKSEENVEKLSEEKETMSFLLKDFEDRIRQQASICANLEQEVLSLKHELNKTTESYEAKLHWCQQNHKDSAKQSKPAEEQKAAYEQLLRDHRELRETIPLKVNERLKCLFENIEKKVSGMDKSLEKLTAKHDELKRNQFRLI